MANILDPATIEKLEKSTRETEDYSGHPHVDWIGTTTTLDLIVTLRHWKTRAERAEVYLTNAITLIEKLLAWHEHRPLDIPDSWEQVQSEARTFLGRPPGQESPRRQT